MNFACSLMLNGRTIFTYIQRILIIPLQLFYIANMLFGDILKRLEHVADKSGPRLLFKVW